MNNNYNQNNMNGDMSYQQYNNGSNTCRLILKREKNFVGSLVAFKIFIDGSLAGKIKNGQTLVLNVTPGQHEVSVNNKNPINIVVNGDTTADVVIYGANNFGITNVGGNNSYASSDNGNLIPKYEKQANTLLIGSIALPILSIILFMATSHKYVLQFWFYSLVIGYGIVNIFGLKNIKGSDNGKYSSILIRNIIAIVISAIALVITIFITNFA